MISSTQDTQAELPQDGIGYPEWYPSKEREVAEAKAGMTIEELRANADSIEGRKKLMKKLNLNGNADQVIEGLDLNMEQIQKKESFLKKMLKAPGRMTMATLNLMKKHPIASTLALLALTAGGIGFAAWKAPAIITWLGELEMAHAGTALGKAAEYLKSFSEFSFGMAGSVPESATTVLPFDA